MWYAALIIWLMLCSQPLCSNFWSQGRSLAVPSGMKRAFYFLVRITEQFDQMQCLAGVLSAGVQYASV